MSNRTNQMIPPAVVMKFGGTSVEDAVAMRRVVSIVQRSLADEEKDSGSARRVVVSSACGGVTDLLVEIARLCSIGQAEEALARVSELSERHRAILRDLEGEKPDDATAQALDSEIIRLERLVHGTTLLGETTPRTIDAILASGERTSTLLLRRAFELAATAAALTSSSTVLITDNRHGLARPDRERTAEACAERLLPLFSDVDVIVMQGFLGGTTDGVITTLGRGGSDYSAALIGAAIEAERIEIWTDVDGIMTADPRVVPAARPVERMTFSEAAELARFGAKVIHPETISPAVEAGIPVAIRNSRVMESAGTTIVSDETPVLPGFHSITGLRDLILLELCGDPESDGITPLLDLFHHHDVAILSAVTTRSTASIVIGAAAWGEPFRTVLEAAASDVVVTERIGLLCLGGGAVRSTPALLCGPLESLRSVPIRQIASGASDHALLMALESERLDEAIAMLHRHLFEEG